MNESMASAERYWEGRWRDEKAENERLKEHLATNDRILDHVRNELAKDSSLVNELSTENERLTATISRQWSVYKVEIERLTNENEQLKADKQRLLNALTGNIAAMEAEHG